MPMPGLAWMAHRKGRVQLEPDRTLGGTDITVRGVHGFGRPYAVYHSIFLVVIFTGLSAYSQPTAFAL
ncbi:hypothetical protein GQ53DRAFT_517083 [Thozetella sp. PMI_491]|nr:hypothetical protein GQ53DRAFT_517083 [Thozetella sp. PMI_491]